jgi:hypothetical protein
MWAHQGLWCKVLQGDPSHREVLRSVPGLSLRRAEVATVALGLGEAALSVLVATRGDRRWVAAVQTALVVAFNLGGLAFGGDHIPEPRRLLVRNAAFIALVWSSTHARPIR